MTRTILQTLLLCLYVTTHAEVCVQDVCEYNFVIRRWRTMTTTIGNSAYDVTLDGSQLKTAPNTYHIQSESAIGTTVNADDVITADGFPRDIITINDQFPGPTIEVMEGAEVVVHVTNQLVLESMSIHWHGMLMRDTPWMDGVPYITQCPINPYHKFTYRFVADPVGTHWYHSHFHAQRLDGLFGMLVIHERVPRLPYFIVTLMDWIHDDAIALEIQNPLSSFKSGTGYMELDINTRGYMVDGVEITPLNFFSGLINGRGRYNDEKFPLTEFAVIDNGRYRFRMAHPGNEHSFEVSVDQHTLYIVASDGNELTEIAVSSFMIHPSETIDFEVEFDQTPGRYWMRANTLQIGRGMYPTADRVEQGTKAIIVYSGDSSIGDPTSTPSTCTPSNNCRVFNCPYEGYPSSYNKECISIADARSTITQSFIDKHYGTKDEDIIEYFFNFAFPIGSSINARRNVFPRAPLFHPQLDQYITPCDREVCDAGGCFCSNIKDLPFNRTVQMTFMSYTPGEPSMGHHTIHMHGHNFAIVAIGFAHLNQSTGFWEDHNEDIKCTSENEYICTTAAWNRAVTLNLQKPPIKDNVIIPARGYVTVRFRTDNPGFWLLHCHQELHLMEGMSMAFAEARDHMKDLPEGFQTCGDFSWTHEQHTQYLKSDGKYQQGDDDDDDDDDDDNNPTIVCAGETDDETMTLKNSDAIGSAFGFVLLGVVVGLIPSVCLCCMKKRNKE